MGMLEAGIRVSANEFYSGFVESGEQMMSANNSPEPPPIEGANPHSREALFARRGSLHGR